MKTVIKHVDRQMLTFFGEALLRNIKEGAGSPLPLLQATKYIAAAKESRYYNIESRIAFVYISEKAKTAAVRDALLDEVGVSARTLRNWRKDYAAYIDGSMQARTVVIRKAI